MRPSIIWGAALCAVVAVAIAPAARAQTPPYYPPSPPPVAAPVAPVPPQGSEIASCLCLKQDVDALGANMGAKQHAYEEVRGQLARLDERLQRDRSALDVNNADAVARFRQLLGERDAMFRRSTGPLATDLSNMTARYNGKVNEYNARCAGRPQDPVLVARVQSTLVCPAPY